MSDYDFKTKKLSEWNDIMYQLHPTPYENKIAGIIEKKRVEAILGLCDIKEEDNVLEIGSESGQILAKIDSANRIVGIDISEVAMNDARERLNGETELIFADAEKKINHSKLKYSSFDVIICSQILEHVAEPEAIMDNIYNLAKDNARIVISVPNELFMLKVKTLLSKTGLMDKFFPGIEPGISEWHLQVFTHNKVKELLGDSFNIEALKRVFNIYLVYKLKKINK